MEETVYSIGDGWGDWVEEPSVEQMRKFLDKLDIDDEEHCEIWLTHIETDWTLSCNPNREVVFYCDAEGKKYKPRHLVNVSREKMLDLWLKLAKGQFEELEKESWIDGQTSEIPRPPIDPQKLYGTCWNQLISSDRIPDLKCRDRECKETAIQFSVFCPKHHFEKIYKIKCPFA